MTSDYSIRFLGPLPDPARGACLPQTSDDFLFCKNIFGQICNSSGCGNAKNSFSGPCSPTSDKMLFCKTDFMTNRLTQQVVEMQKSFQLQRASPPLPNPAPMSDKIFCSAKKTDFRTNWATPQVVEMKKTVSASGPLTRSSAYESR